MIKGKVLGQHLCVQLPLIVEGSIDYLTAELTFSRDWDGADKWIHFAMDDTVYDIHIPDGIVTTEDHLNLESGIWAMYIHGSKADGTRITTNEVMFRVTETGILDGEPLPKIPLTAAEQISLDAAEARRIAESVRQDADEGKFDAKVTDEDKREIADIVLENIDVGTSFKTDETLSLKDGVLGVNTAKDLEEDGTLPITAGAVAATVGNIEILLKTI